MIYILLYKMVKNKICANTYCNNNNNNILPDFIFADTFNIIKTENFNHQILIFFRFVSW